MEKLAASKYFEKLSEAYMGDVDCDLKIPQYEIKKKSSNAGLEEKINVIQNEIISKLSKKEKEE